MPFDGKSLDEYVDVATRLAEFRAAHPSGSLQPADPTRPWEQAVVNGIDKTGKPFAATMIVYVAAAYRTPDDPRPGIGVAWEPFPGRTPYTLGSELMNAETSAWGRAIVAALAADTRKGIATRQDVERGNGHGPPEQDPWAGQPAGEFDASAVEPENRPGSADSKQLRHIHTRLTNLGIKDREEGLALIENIIDAELAGPHRAEDGSERTSKNLSWQQAETVRKELSGQRKVATP